MNRRGILALMGGALTLAGCGPRVVSYSGPPVTKVVVFKEKRQMYLMSGDTALRSYAFRLGFAPTGHKTKEGDGRTPEGDYIINRRNPASRFYKSIGISYPNARDVARARKLGVSPGGDIFIHGTPRRFSDRTDDWTWGCIAVHNPEIEEIYSMVGTGTPISIYP